MKLLLLFPVSCAYIGFSQTAIEGTPDKTLAAQQIKSIYDYSIHNNFNDEGELTYSNSFSNCETLYRPDGRISEQTHYEHGQVVSHDVYVYHDTTLVRKDRYRHEYREKTRRSGCIVETIPESELPTPERDTVFYKDEYNAEHRLIKRVATLSTGKILYTSLYDYDRFGNCIYEKWTDIHEWESWYDYDDQHRRIRTKIIFEGSKTIIRESYEDSLVKTRTVKDYSESGQSEKEVYTYRNGMPEQIAVYKKGKLHRTETFLYEFDDERGSWTRCEMISDGYSIVTERHLSYY